MVVLGVADGPRPAAALVSAGRLVGLGVQPAVVGVPWEAIDQALRVARLGPADVESVQLAGRWTGVANRRGLSARVPAAFGWIAQTALRATGLGVAEADREASRWEVALKGRGFRPHRVALVDVHVALAEAAYRLQAHDAVSIAVWEPLGDGLCLSVWSASAGQLTRVATQGGLSSLHLFEARLARRLQLAEPDPDQPAWASLPQGGQVDAVIVHGVARAFSVDDGRFEGQEAAWDALSAAPRELAASSAREGMTLGLSRWLRAHVAPSRPLVLAGRGFADVRLVDALSGQGLGVSVVAGPAVTRWARAAGAALRAAGPPPVDVGARWVDIGGTANLANDGRPGALP